MPDNPQERDAEVIPGIYAETILPDEQIPEFFMRMAELANRTQPRIIFKPYADKYCHPR